MNKLNQTSVYCREIVGWWLGANNASAIKDVLNDKYHYNELDSATMKVRQIGSEILHLGLKWATLGVIADNVILHPIFGEPTPGTFRASVNNLYAPIPVNFVVSTAINYGVTLSGLASLGYAGQQCMTDVTEMKKAFVQIVQRDWEGNINISISHVGECFTRLANLSTLIPIYKSVSKFGLPGANIAAPLAYLSNISEKDISYNSKTSKAEKLIRPAILATSIASYWL